MITSYEALPLGKYLQIVSICKDEGEDIDKQVAILAVLTGKKVEDILNLPVAEYSSLALRTSFLNEEMPKPTGRVLKAYKIGGFELRPLNRIEDMTASQYIDFQTFAKNEGAIAELLSVLLIPKGKTYNKDYDIIAVQDAIKAELPCLYANDILAFFLSRFVSSIRSMLTYSEWIVKKIPDESKRAEITQKIQEARTILHEDGDGLLTLMQLPRPTGHRGAR